MKPDDNDKRLDVWKARRREIQLRAIRLAQVREKQNQELHRVLGKLTPIKDTSIGE